MDKKKVGKLSEVFGSGKGKKDIPQARIGGGMSFKEKKEYLESFLGQHSEKSKLQNHK